MPDSLPAEIVHRLAASIGIPLRGLDTQEDGVRLTTVWERGTPLGTDALADEIAAIAAHAPTAASSPLAPPRPRRRWTGATPPCSSRAAGRTEAWPCPLRREEDRGPDRPAPRQRPRRPVPRAGEETRRLDAMRQAAP